MLYQLELDTKLDAVLQKVRFGNSCASAEMRGILEPGLRVIAQRQISDPDADIVVEKALREILDSIRFGQMRAAHDLRAYAESVVVRRTTTWVRGSLDPTPAMSAEPKLLAAVWQALEIPPDCPAERERSALERSAAALLSQRERDILARVYIMRDSSEEICESEGFTLQEFHIRKGRAKATFNALRRGCIPRKAVVSTKYTGSTGHEDPAGRLVHRKDLQLTIPTE